MFGLFNKKKPVSENVETVTLKLGGMHCASCAMNIDGELEETAGVIETSTNYAKAEAKITFDSTKVELTKLKKVIEKLGYSATE